MKITNIALSLALIGTMSLGMAEDATVSAETTTTTDTTTTSTETTVSVDAQIEAIQTAPAQERVRLMNQFKERLMQMNEADRSAAIAQMQSAMGDAQNIATTAQDMGTQRALRANQKAQNLQMEATQTAAQMQNMHQMQVGKQIANMPTNPPVGVTPGAHAPVNMVPNVTPVVPNTTPAAGGGMHLPLR
jgi:hypothetical protein